MPKPVLQVVPQSEPSRAEQTRQRLRRAAKPAAILQCPRCAGREMIETRTGVLLRDGKASGGTKQMLCAGCLARGERVVVA